MVMHDGNVEILDYLEDQERLNADFKHYIPTQNQTETKILISTATARIIHHQHNNKVPTNDQEIKHNSQLQKHVIHKTISDNLQCCHQTVKTSKIVCGSSTKNSPNNTQLLVNFCPHDTTIARSKFKRLRTKSLTDESASLARKRQRTNTRRKQMQQFNFSLARPYFKYGPCYN